ncbi:MAG: glycosyltransferase family 4 protein [Pirellulales bacterium]|nr:glycosyltransferase family 4 protein [Pirellulales bacterium]
MKVALVIEEYDPSRGGVEQWTYQFARQLTNWGHDIHVVARRFGNCFDHDIERHYVPTTATRLGFASAAAEKLRNMRIDVVHDTGAGWRAHVLQPHGGSRTAAFRQNLLLLPRWARPLKEQACRWLPRYREFDQLVSRQYANDGRLILAISKMVAHDLQRWHGVSRERIRIVYNGVDTVRFSPLHRERHREQTRQAHGIGTHETLLLIVAHNLALKGVPTLLRSVAALAREGAPLRLIVAGGKRVGPYRRMAGRLGVGDRVEFIGAVSDPVPFYAAADLYVQPTLYDPCSLVALEALASGLPVVTSRYNGAGELIKEGEHGYVIGDPLDERELADAIRPLLNQDRRELMSAAARKLALSHTFERNCREILSVYQEVSQLRRRAA